MKRRTLTYGWLSIIAAVLVIGLALFIGLTAPPTLSNPILMEDHFKIYHASEPMPGGFSATITLTDQFGTVNHLVTEPFRFANPVQKDLEPIQDPDAHLSAWRIWQTAPHDTHIVGVHDQFGFDIWELYEARWLLAPALKQDVFGPLPFKNHYKCYGVISGPTINRVVTLVDQVDTVQVVVLEAYGFCNPVEKIAPDGTVYPIVEPQMHLAIYKVSNPNTYGVIFLVRDQFVEGHTGLGDNLWLAVPAGKEYPIAIEESTWGRIKALYKSEEDQ
jgi:hypothetical protein